MKINLVGWEKTLMKFEQLKCLFLAFVSLGYSFIRFVPSKF
jgi:hypothetical protein